MGHSCSMEPDANISPRERFLSYLLIGTFSIEAWNDAADFEFHVCHVAPRPRSPISALGASRKPAL
jgi:hypothetical protein